jgi:hypothetical protein
MKKKTRLLIHLGFFISKHSPYFSTISRLMNINKCYLAYLQQFNAIKEYIRYTFGCFY